jgi:hypothetical protein
LFKGKHFALPLFGPSKRMRSPSDKYNCCGCFVVCKIEKNNAKQNFSDLPQFGVIVKGGFANVQVG